MDTLHPDSMPMVSVIIPTHNRAEFIADAITSVLEQTYKNFELFIVDDASTDITAEVVSKFDDKRIHYIRHDTNKGGSAARNTGIRNSTYDYIAFLDDDDEWLPDKLEKQVQTILSSIPEVGCVYTGCFRVDKTTGKVIDHIIPTKRGNIDLDLRLQNCVGGSSSVLLKRECLDKVGLFDETLPCSQDYDLWIRLAKEFSFECIQEPLFRYYHHQEKISTNVEVLSRGSELMAKKHCFLSKKYYVNRDIEIGILYCLDGNMSKGRRAFLDAVKLLPFQFRGYFNLFLTVLGQRKFRKIKDARRRMFSLIETGVGFENRRTTRP
jgi:glycosyltransferase involved in cell wall biosynthesis